MVKGYAADTGLYSSSNFYQLVTLGKLLNFSKLQFFHLKNGDTTNDNDDYDDDGTDFIG